ncbi:hypothetical protein NKF26_19810 [Haladaptatus sp. AB618]|uniref:hypothetical protein n=1 Tax=Haladaptatus sp. AB618 TaxID=2934173 RepID=UPI00209C68C9|nr:hypothetical protein [Haladaptatus sp. AB618]MCO8256059.1 hypothetical protein [Haladaptatus sp. AB618]
MGLRDHANEVANDAKARTMTAARRARGVGETVARKTADTGSEAGGEALRTVRETVESVHGRVDGSEGVEAIPEPSVVSATTDQATTALTVEIRQFLDDVDHRYAAKSAFNGARQGYAAGPYGAVLGAGAGTVYGAYNSTRDTFDPEAANPNEGIDVGQYLDGIGHVRTGYEAGKRFGTKGKVAGAAIGAGVSVLPLVRELSSIERADEPLSHYVDSISLPSIDGISVRRR